MSGQTLPPLPLSSSEADLRSSQSTSSISSESDAFPFLVHSQRAVTNGEPPEVDNTRLARQKRRRTSTEDQATLEAEYKRNPKPDKIARLEIVKKVSLGEKEVQIWFQNRRQNTRRKSRPLLPHEIVAFGLGGMASLSSGSTSRDGGQHIAQNSSSTNAETPIGSQDVCKIIKDESHILRNMPFVTLSADAAKQVQTHLDACEPMRAHLAEPQLFPILPTEKFDLTRSFASSQPIPPTLGYLSNRRNTPNPSLGDIGSSRTPYTTLTSNSQQSPPSSCPEVIITADSDPSSSHVRLSLSLDGKAELVSSEVSPQRSSQPHPLSNSLSSEASRRQSGVLKRGYSTLPLDQLLQNPKPELPLVPRIPSGRSRDARTWEFCCDTDTRDELTTQAENESSGSALAAISLLRSTSFGALKHNISKRNAPNLNAKSRTPGKKPKLGRASSSLARLQETSKYPRGSASGDSDKENWVPEDHFSNLRRRNVTERRPEKKSRRRVLEESKRGSTFESALRNEERALQKPSHVDDGIYKDRSGHGDSQEVDNFMRGEVSPSKKGDLDCIQGLLSLSQGTWR